MNAERRPVQQLLSLLEELYPAQSPSDLLRIALLLTLHVPEWECIVESEAELSRQCHEVSLRMGAAGDQHAAVAAELDQLAATSPCEYSPEHLWTLVRAIRVQSQILDLYLGMAVAP